MSEARIVAGPSGSMVAWTAIAAALFLGGCSELGNSGGEQRAQERVEHTAVAHAMASVDPTSKPPVDSTATPRSDVAFKWSGAEALTGTPRGSSQSLPAELTNLLDKEVTGRITLVAQGLDGRKVVRVLEKFLLPARASREVMVPIGKLPIQSEVSLSFLALIAEVERPKGIVHISTPALYYRFRNGYQEALVYNAREAAKIPFEPPGTQDMIDVQGRILEVDGTVTDAALVAARAAEEARASDQGKQALSTFGSVPIDPDTNRAILPFPIKQPKAAGWTQQGAAEARASAAPVNATVTICSTWNVQYIDSDPSEDYFNTDDWTSRPASQAFAYVFDGSWNLYWWGNLDGYGCVSSLSLPPGNYFMFQVTEETRRADKVFHALEHGAGGGASASYAMTWFTVYPLSGWVYLTPWASTAQIQVAAVTGQILAMDAWTTGGLGLTPNWPYTVFVNEGCDTTNPAACYGAPNNTPPHGGVFLGITDPGGVGEEHWKHIIGHELGHFVQDIAMGMHNRSYSDFAVSEPTCMCNFFNPDEMHCLQSREDIGTAQIEGFAHAFSSRIFNSSSDANGTFVYYKPFLDDGLNSNPPPQSFSTYYPEHWMQNHCPDADRGIEMDWMSFYFNVMSLATSNPTSPQDLFSIYRRACTGNPNSNCNNSHPMPWATLDQNAKTHFGGSPSNPNYLRFRDTGLDSGVAW